MRSFDERHILEHLYDSKSKVPLTVRHKFIYSHVKKEVFTGFLYSPVKN